MPRSSAIANCTPTPSATRHLVDRDRLALMKPTALLINTARGGLIDEQALARALRGGRLGGAVLDVREQEPPGDDDPLRGLPSLILTPHIAGLTAEAGLRSAMHVAQDVLRVLAGEDPLSEIPAAR